MLKSDALDKFAPAFIDAQREMEHATKNAQNPHLKNKYANLAEVIDTVTPTLNRHDLGVLQFPGWSGERVTVTTIVIHRSGQYIGGVAETPIPKQDPQGTGSGTSYLRRYSLAAVGCITQEDDDGEGALKRKEKAAKAESTPPEVRETAKAVAAGAPLVDTLHKAIQDQINSWPEAKDQGDIPALQRQIRTLYDVDKRLGNEVYQAARRAGIVP